MSGARPMLRLAWRSIRRNPGRSALVFCLIALMVGASTTVSTLARTGMTSPDEQRRAALGAAELQISLGNHPIFAPALLVNVGSAPQIDGAAPTLDDRVDALDPFSAAERVGRLLGTDVVGSRWLTAWDVVGRSSAVVGPYGSTVDDLSPAQIQVSDLDPDEPLLAGLAELSAGRAPIADNEIVVPERVAEANQLSVGDTWSIAEVPHLVVGTLRQPARRNVEVSLVSPAGFDRLRASVTTTDRHLRLFAASADTAMRTPQFTHVLSNEFGIERAAVGLLFDPRLNPGIGSREDLGLVAFDDDPALVAPDRRPAQLSTLIASLLAIEVALVAAAAFAVSTRRRTREFGQLLATGADHRHIRMLILIEAALLGALGALAGAVLGVVAAWGIHASEILNTPALAPNELRWNLVDWLGPLLVGIAASGAAAWGPAKRLETISPSVALSGHLPVERPRRRTPRLGVAALIVGTAGFLASSSLLISRSADNLVIAALSMVSVLAMFAGALSMIGHVLQWLGDRADRLGLRSRLVVRNSARHQTRAWAAIGAFVALIVVPVVIAASIKGYPGNLSNPPDDRERRVSVIFDGSTQSLVPNGGILQYAGPPQPGLDAENRRFADELDARISDIVVVEERTTWDKVDESTWLSTGDNSWSAGAHLTAVENPELMSLLGANDLTPGSRTAVVINGPRGADQVGIDATGPTPISDMTLLPVEHRKGHTLAPFWAWVVVPPDVAEAEGWTTSIGGLVWKLDRAPDTAMRAQIEAAANEVWLDIWGAPANPDSVRPTPSVAVGFDNLGIAARTMSLITVGIATAVAALIALIAAALAAVEVDREIGSMIASGASPTIRRWLLGAQTMYHLLIAAAIGVPLAVLLFWAGSRADTNGPRGLVVPWTAVTVMAIVVPLVIGAAIAVLFRNGRPAVSRRLS